jgi:signal transduction histidine kinase
LTLLVLILAVVSLSIIDRTTRIAQLHSNISQLEIHTLSMIKSDNDFFDIETINDNYFTTHTSNFLDKHDSLHKLIVSEILALTQGDFTNDADVVRNLHVIDSTLRCYDRQFNTLESLIYQRGFKDYGVEGQMRKHAHALERNVSQNNIVHLLYLRRHEKDFLLRDDTSYVLSFRQRAKVLSAAMHEENNTEGIEHLEAYQKLFFQLVTIQRELGLSSKKGLRSELNILTNRLAEQYYALSEYAYHHAEMANQKLRIFYILLLGGAILFSLLSGYWISKRLSAPIAKLSREVREALVTRTTATTDFGIRNAAVEISTLANSFVLLIEQLNKQLDKSKLKSVLLKEKNRELKKINRELDNFLYSTAHDLRSPLSSLLGLLNIMRYENKQPELLVHLDMMESSLQRSENFISQIVSFSKNKRLMVVPEKINLRAILQDIFDDHQFIEGADRIRKDVQIIDPIPFYSDRNRMMIVFSNLVSNAIKYADREKAHSDVVIRVEITHKVALIEFSDNGVGIEQEHLTRIFDMFYRAHDSSKGSGLGLFIFKEAITRMGGAVSVESAPGVGTKFRIELPNLSPKETSDHPLDDLDDISIGQPQHTFE